MNVRFGLIAVAVLAGACAGAPAGNEMTINHKAGAFSGTAGADWSDEDLQSNAFAVLCPQGDRVVDLKIDRDANGTAKVSGRCVK